MEPTAEEICAACDAYDTPGIPNHFDDMRRALKAAYAIREAIIQDTKDANANRFIRGLRALRNASK
jgi:hypothetical protein